jgi:molybdopterin converting factor small subunit
MKTLITTLVSQQIKTNLQTEADTKGITLSKLVYKILKQYEQTNLSRETTEVAQKSNNKHKEGKIYLRLTLLNGGED